MTVHTHGPPLGEQTVNTMTCYPTQSHYPDTEPTSPCHTVIMQMAWLVSSDKYQFSSQLIRPFSLVFVQRTSLSHILLARAYSHLSRTSGHAVILNAADILLVHLHGYLSPTCQNKKSCITKVGRKILYNIALSCHTYSSSKAQAPGHHWEH